MNFGEIAAIELTALVLDQRPTDLGCGFKIFEHRLIDFAQILPRIFVTVKTVEKQHIGQQAEHPIDVGRVSDDCAATGAFKKVFRKLLSVTAFEHIARSEVDQIGSYTETFECVAKRLLADALKNGFYCSRLAMKGEIIDRCVNGAGIAPE